MTKVPRRSTTHADPIGDRETQRPPVELMLRDLPAQHREIIVATYFRRRTTREAARIVAARADAPPRALGALAADSDRATCGHTRAGPSHR